MQEGDWVGMIDRDETTDVLVIGAGPGGLTAATYLGRFLRGVLVADGGTPRAHWIPVSHNMPGFPAGITGPAILTRMREQASEYGAVLEAGRAEALTVVDGGFVARLNGRSVRARGVVLATGVQDRMPDIPDVAGAVTASVLRICPICDGYEARGRRVAVIGDDDAGVREAAFLRTYTADVTLIHTGPAAALTERSELARLGVALVETPVERIAVDADRVTAVTWAGRETAFDMVYSALGTKPANSLATGLGAALESDGRLIVDDHGRTSIPGLYAVGDVVRGLNQIAVATAEAAIAATAIHNHLREAEGLVVRATA
jgi:thioredoxin reductase (NADPH)